jgi:hypothetical protein
MFQHEGSGEYVYMAQRWNLALDNAQAALDALREIYPSHSWLTTETGGRYIDAAMTKIKDGVVDLHRAGPHVLGQETYEDFKQELADRHTGSPDTTRGEL